MTAGFVESRMIRPAMAQIVLLGANVGTALTAWIVAAWIEAISPFLVLLGFILRRQAKPLWSGLSLALFGVGLMLLSLSLAGGLSPAVVLVLGANFGGAIPPVLATLWSEPASQRMTQGNLAIRAIGCLIAMPFAGMGDPPGRLAGGGASGVQRDSCGGDLALFRGDRAAGHQV